MVSDTPLVGDGDETGLPPGWGVLVTAVFAFGAGLGAVQGDPTALDLVRLATATLAALAFAAALGARRLDAAPTPNGVDDAVGVGNALFGASLLLEFGPRVRTDPVSLLGVAMLLFGIALIGNGGKVLWRTRTGRGAEGV